MGNISLRSNIASLRAQRQLAQSNGRLTASFERLSSGLRINRASDDAAGIAISSSLRTDARVYGQALRNANDTVSALNIAEGAASQLSGIVFRLKELAQGAANGTFGLGQRLSIDTEANELTQEFNRIINSTDFNNIKLIDGTLNDLAVQLGYGTQERIGFSLGGGLKRYVGTGSFSSQGSITLGGTATTGSVIEDINGDGKNDLIAATDAGVIVRLGNGDGTFQTAATAQSATDVDDMVLADVNNDGKVDLLSTSGPSAYVSFGNGDGTFGSATQYNLGNTTESDIAVGDFNGDGAIDFVTGGSGGNLRVHLNSGTGDFSNNSQVSMFGTTNGRFAIAIGDMNGDGRDDIIASSADTSTIALRLGNGDGTFGAASVVTSTENSVSDLILADFDHDGILDLASAGGVVSTMNVRLGNGDGTFGAASTQGEVGNYLESGDINGDGVLDLVGLTGALDTALTIHLGNGDGTFSLSDEIDTGPNVQLSLGDLNGDGVPDILFSDTGSSNLNQYRADTSQVTTIERFNLTTQDDALEALTRLDSYLSRISDELGRIGSTQSRLKSALNTLGQIRLNYEAANSRIVDIDVAGESASLVAASIKQQIGSAVLAQANLLPQLVLNLLESA